MIKIAGRQKHRRHAESNVHFPYSRIGKGGKARCNGVAVTAQSIRVRCIEEEASEHSASAWTVPSEGSEGIAQFSPLLAGWGDGIELAGGFV